MQSKSRCAEISLVRRSLARLSALLLMAGFGGVAAHAQNSSGVLETLDKAKSKSEKQSVEDLIKKLQGRSDKNKDNSPVSTPQPTAAVPGSNTQQSKGDVASEPGKMDPTPAQQETPPAATDKPTEVAVPVTRPAQPEPASVLVEPALPSADHRRLFRVCIDDRRSSSRGDIGCARTCIVGYATCERNIPHRRPHGCEGQNRIQREPVATKGGSRPRAFDHQHTEWHQRGWLRWDSETPD